MSPRVFDERRTKHEESLAAGSQQQPTRAELPQFTLGDLLAFLTGIAACMSLGATATKMGSIEPLRIAFFGAAAVVAWGVLLATYRKLHFRVALIFHWVGPALLLGLVLLMCAWIGVDGVLRDDPSALGLGTVSLLVAFPLAICCGCVFGLILSLPAFLVTIAVVVVRATFH